MSNTFPSSNYMFTMMDTKRLQRTSQTASHSTFHTPGYLKIGLSISALIHLGTWTKPCVLRDTQVVFSVTLRIHIKSREARHNQRNKTLNSKLLYVTQKNYLVSHPACRVVDKYLSLSLTLSLSLYIYIERERERKIYIYIYIYVFIYIFTHIHVEVAVLPWNILVPRYLTVRMTKISLFLLPTC